MEGRPQAVQQQSWPILWLLAVRHEDNSVLVERRSL
eukprot:COSAG01_NODE_50939_length_359_cov_0.588462_1_plen_36_part_00